MLRKLFISQCLLLASGSLLSAHGHSQGDFSAFEEDPIDLQAVEAYFQDWFQVELIVFERRDQVSSNERWPKNLFLAYPPNSTHLYTEEGWIEANTPLPDPLDETSAYSLGIENESSPESLDNQAAQNTADAFDQEDFLSDTTLEHLPENDEPLPADEWKETPFIKLDADNKQLQSEFNKLNSSSRYRVLFHESWRQQIKGNSDAQSIIVLGGDQFEEHRELEGSVRLSLGRYLHIKTQLWFTEFESNYGQASEHWPSLPEIPDTYLLAQSESVSTAFDPLQSEGADLLFHPNTNSSLYSGFELTEDLSSGLFDAEKESAYLIRQIITLSQQRRMRSNELHYIDHPRLGILIKIEPYTHKLLSQEPNN